MQKMQRGQSGRRVTTRVTNSCVLCTTNMNELVRELSFDKNKKPVPVELLRIFTLLLKHLFVPRVDKSSPENHFLQSP